MWEGLGCGGAGGTWWDVEGLVGGRHREESDAHGALGDKQRWHSAPGKVLAGLGATTPPLLAAAPSQPAEERKILHPAEASGEEKFQKEEYFALRPGLKKQ